MRERKMFIVITSKRGTEIDRHSFATATDAGQFAWADRMRGYETQIIEKTARGYETVNA